MQTQAHARRLTLCKHPQADAQDAAASTASASMPPEAACNCKSDARAASSVSESDQCSTDSSDESGDSKQGDEGYIPTGMATQSRDRLPKFMDYMSEDAAHSVLPRYLQTVAGAVLHSGV